MPLKTFLALLCALLAGSAGCVAADDTGTGTGNAATTVSASFDDAIAAATSTAGVITGGAFNIWRGTPPGETTPPRPERRAKNLAFVRDVWTPALEFRPAPAATNTGTAVIVCPGGGYSGLAYAHEGLEVAKWLNSIGVNAFILKYRVPTRPGQKRGVMPLMDAQRAVSLVRANAAAWNIRPDRIGILGFSAGAHLSALTSCAPKRTYAPTDAADALPCRPNFTVLIYPAYIVEKGRFTDEFEVTAETPPAFFVHAVNDPYTYKSSAHYFEKLRTFGTNAELHIFGQGGHGFGLRKNSPGDLWPAAATAWLRANKWLAPAVPPATKNTPKNTAKKNRAATTEGVSIQRATLSLDGTWKIAKTTGDTPPASAADYTSETPVPGLVDNAKPALEINPKKYDKTWYWHRRTFTVGGLDSDVAQLKIFKAKYRTHVYVNGKFAGANDYSFTPSYFDLKPFLKLGENEIVIGVGCKEQVPPTVPDGHDNEKVIYIPGIYDKVELTFANKPFIANVQCAPNIPRKQLRVVAELEVSEKNGDAKTPELRYRVVEKKTQRIVATGSAKAEKTANASTLGAPSKKIADFTIPLPDATLWTPENPFLYQLVLFTTGDTKRTTFGMRSFRFDQKRNTALLNEKPYFPLGTNVCIFRFFEDPKRGVLPWKREWVEALHKRFKEMNWHAARYCIGFPPEEWYDIADELGFLIQDEFPFWDVQNRQPKLKAKHMAEEYRRWLRERWNHPCVVIWDAQNECRTPETGKAANMVRALDLSNRPWENGWAPPASLTEDVCEAHPYLFLRYMGRGKKPSPAGYKKEIYGKPLTPRNDANERSPQKDGGRYPNPLLINEYGWLWLNRDGSPTTLTGEVWKNVWDGEKLSKEKRFEIYARELAALTEFWRAHRRSIGILHFCGLGYSRTSKPRGQTSDHWQDIEQLKLEPNFAKFVKPAFAPVGLFIDYWKKSEKRTTGSAQNTAGSAQNKTTKRTFDAPLYLINDTPQKIEKNIVITIENTTLNTAQNTAADRALGSTTTGATTGATTDALVHKQTVRVACEPNTVSVTPLKLPLPDAAGAYQIRAAIAEPATSATETATDTTGATNTVFCLRDLVVE
ncbi:MAG: alpha/beta hydrolase fold domain-containing protein [Puniceicoccales bacterium]|jgi:acetyl esterase/lipase|nr:alpha/beta hydrolase fold domain-containing protein [Puniceicoccales bacterium]